MLAFSPWTAAITWPSVTRARGEALEVDGDANLGFGVGPGLGAAHAGRGLDQFFEVLRLLGELAPVGASSLTSAIWTMLTVPGVNWRMSSENTSAGSEGRTTLISRTTSSYLRSGSVP